MMRVGLIGIGNMGLPMALRLLDRGFGPRVRDLRAEPEALAAAAGARVCANAAELAMCCELVLLVVVDATQIDAVLFGEDGAAAQLAPGAIVAVCSTIAPHEVEQFAARLAGRGIVLIDAPISGGPSRARDGRLTIMAAGPDSALQRAATVLDALATRVVAVGPRVGDGARAKLVNNLLAGINLAAAAEAFALAERLGLDPARVLEIVRGSSGQSWILEDRIPRALAGDFEPRAHTRILAKDLHLATACAAQAGFATPLGERAQALFQAACGQGMAEFDDSAVLIAARRLYTEPPGSG